MPTPIQLSDDRAFQLRAYAQGLGVGITEAIGILLNSVGATEKVPGFEIIAVGPLGARMAYIFQFGDFGIGLDATHMAKLADLIEHCAATAGSGGKQLTNEKQRLEIVIGRHRRHSIIITGRSLDTATQATRALTLDVAKDLARQIRNKLAEA